jgi:tetraacyldisaccharide 4'-kinase
VERIWYGRSLMSSLVRGALRPFSSGYWAVMRARNALYDRGLLTSHASGIPVISVGNLTVGGTGKTPFSAYLVALLAEIGHKPAVVMRGYGDDETRLHAELNPGVTIVADADRVAGIRSAVHAGADVAVLDDGFQHRRARRDLDIVLVSADRWSGSDRVLPAGPFRERLPVLKRASLIVVTQKIASDDATARVAHAIARISGVTAPIVVAYLEPGALVADDTGENASLESIRGETVLAIAGIGDPASFFNQLRSHGAIVTERRLADHHRYTSDEAKRFAAEGQGHKYVVTTQKDLVKLSSLWPARSARLWYLSQAVRLPAGDEPVVTALASVFQRATSIS